MVEEFKHAVEEEDISEVDTGFDNLLGAILTHPPLPTAGKLEAEYQASNVDAA